MVKNNAIIQCLTIKQLSNLSGLSAYTLRYYEKEGLIIGIRRNNVGHRCYSNNDMEWIEFLKRLKTTGMPIAAMRRFAQLRKQGNKTISARKKMLEIHQQKVMAEISLLQENLAIITNKIKIYKKMEITQHNA
ncbi:TPA: MerR family transcriptional regulator [Candidatus Dependentiae bacterium]|nr:MerR family transcriptional regulator [Candidatus Dependentiae bacterium]